MGRPVLCLALGLLFAAPAWAADPAAPPEAAQDAAPTGAYPVAARSAYILGCMATNGNTPEALTRCSCAFAVVAGQLQYPAYATAARLFAARARGGTIAGASPALARLEAAQEAADRTCFQKTPANSSQTVANAG